MVAANEGGRRIPSSEATRGVIEDIFARQEALRGGLSGEKGGPVAKRKRELIAQLLRWRHEAFGIAFSSETALLRKIRVTINKGERSEELHEYSKNRLVLSQIPFHENERLGIAISILRAFGHFGDSFETIQAIRPVDIAAREKLPNYTERSFKEALEVTLAERDVRQDRATAPAQEEKLRRLHEIKATILAPRVLRIRVHTHLRPAMEVRKEEDENEPHHGLVRISFKNLYFFILAPERYPEQLGGWLTQLIAAGGGYTSVGLRSKL